MRLKVGDATIRMDGVARVETLEAYRHRGFARQVLSVALRRIKKGDAALSMLYGITDFYPQFGYITVGPESTITLPPARPEVALPNGMSVRLFRIDDLPSVQRLYDRATASVMGAAVRPREGYPWTFLVQSVQDGSAQDCRMVTDASERVVAYAWRGQWLTFVRAHAEYNPDHLILAEVVADGPRSAEAALTECRQWAIQDGARRGQELKGVMLFMPHEGPVAAAAMHMPSTFCKGYGPDGGWMGRVLSARRLFESLHPEISLRLREARHLFTGRLHLVTDAGDVSLLISGDGVFVEREESQALKADHITPTGQTLVCRLPQTTLVRLVTGSFPPRDLLFKLPKPPDERTIDLLESMFPRRTSQIYLADRF
jgi:hypothetical protein